MKVEKILIYGSSPLAREACELIGKHYDLVGHIPSVNPALNGTVDLPIVDESVEHDIKLSLQYNRKLKNIENAFNVHTGLLPRWGGTDILYHTLKQSAHEQGITFHKMGEEFDYGPIISTTTYPVEKNDSMLNLYFKLWRVFPGFVLNSLKLLENVKDVDSLYKEKPTIFKRGDIKDSDKELYAQTLESLKLTYEY